MRHHQSSDPEVTKLTADMCRDRRDTCLTRVTKEGRTLTYFIKVIQQPSRARACGSGAKCKGAHLLKSYLLEVLPREIQ